MWISVEERLPEIGSQVPVRGQFTDPYSGYPKAVYDGVTINGLSGFSSSDWRGTVAITHWWESDAEFLAKQVTENTRVATQ